MTAAQLRILLALAALVAVVATATAAILLRDDGGAQRAVARATTPASPRAGASSSPSTGGRGASTPPPSPTPTRTPAATPRRLAELRVRAPSSVNVRSGPGVNYPVVGALEPGMDARAVRRNIDASWLLVDLGARSGWVAAGVVEVSGDPVLLFLAEPDDTATPTPAASPSTSSTPSPTGTRTATPTATVSASVTPPATASDSARPDLMLRDAFIGAANRVTVIVSNVGAGPLTARRVSVAGIDESGSIVFSEVTAPLTISAGSALNVELSYRVTAPALLTIVLNGDGSIDEASAANNRRTVALTPR